MSSVPSSDQASRLNYLSSGIRPRHPGSPNGNPLCSMPPRGACAASVLICFIHPTRESQCRLKAVNHERGRHRGPLFRNKKGHRAKIGDFESEFLARMIRLKLARPRLFVPYDDFGERDTEWDTSRSMGGSRSSSKQGTQARPRSCVSEQEGNASENWRFRRRVLGTNDPTQNLASGSLRARSRYFGVVHFVSLVEKRLHLTSSEEAV